MTSPKNEPERYPLPNKRKSHTHKFDVGGQEGYLIVGMYKDGGLGEIFIRMNKEGSTIGSLTDAWATAVSIGLQHGIPLRTFTGKFMHWNFPPNGFTRTDGIPMARSILDYVCKWLDREFDDDGRWIRYETEEKEEERPEYREREGEGLEDSGHPSS